jgi:glycogen synthase
LVIAGDGPEKLDLERLAHRLRVDHAVRFAGPVAPRNIPDLLNSATLVVVPSRREGLPMVAVEAGMMARPVVAAETGGLPEVVLDGQTGVLVPKEDVNALAEAMCALLGQPAMAAQMGRRARDKVQVMFARNASVEAYSRIYESLSRERRTTIRALSRAGSKENNHGRASAALS